MSSLILAVSVEARISHNHELLAKICALASNEISKFIISKSKIDKAVALLGMALFVQRFVSSVNLNPHFHIIAINGVFEQKSTGRYKFYHIVPPNNEDIAHLVHKISTKINKCLVKIAIFYECDGEYNLENNTLLFDTTDIHMPAIKGEQRDRLEKLISDMSRHCIAKERIEILSNNIVQIKLKTA